MVGKGADATAFYSDGLELDSNPEFAYMGFGKRDCIACECTSCMEKPTFLLNYTY